MRFALSRVESEYKFYNRAKISFIRDEIVSFQFYFFENQFENSFSINIKEFNKYFDYIIREHKINQLI